MSVFASNLVLAGLWAVVTGTFTGTNLFLGFAIGYVALWVTRSTRSSTRYFARIPVIVRFFAFYVRQMILANLRVAYDVVTPTFYLKPAVVAVPIEARTDLEIALLANLITLTPGTLSLDLSDDRKTLYIHALYLDSDVETFRREIREGLERRVLELLR